MAGGDMYNSLKKTQFFAIIFIFPLSSVGVRAAKKDIVKLSAYTQYGYLKKGTIVPIPNGRKMREKHYVIEEKGSSARLVRPIEEVLFATHSVDTPNGYRKLLARGDAVITKDLSSKGTNRLVFRPKKGPIALKRSALIFLDYVNKFIEDMGIHGLNSGEREQINKAKERINKIIEEVRNVASNDHRYPDEVKVARVQVGAAMCTFYVYNNEVYFDEGIGASGMLQALNIPIKDH